MSNVPTNEDSVGDLAIDEVAQALRDLVDDGSLVVSDDIRAEVETATALVERQIKKAYAHGFVDGVLIKLGKRGHEWTIHCDTVEQRYVFICRCGHVVTQAPEDGVPRELVSHPKQPAVDEMVGEVYLGHVLDTLRLALTV